MKAENVIKFVLGDPPFITDFQCDDLNQPGDVLSGFSLPCKASGTRHSEYRWQHNGQDIDYNTAQQYRLLKSETLEGTMLSSKNNADYQCFVKNYFGEDFSKKLKIVVSGKIICVSS